MSKQTILMRVVIPSLCLLFLGTSCVQQGNMMFNSPFVGEKYSISGTIAIANPVESDLLASMKAISPEIISTLDYSKFVVTASGTTKNAEKTGTFSLANVPYSPTLLLQAQAGKIVLMKRLYTRDLRQTDLSKIQITVDTTTRALIWQKAYANGVELTEADIEAREYADTLASISLAIRLAMIMPKKDVPKTILDLDMVTKPVAAAANLISPREKTLVEAHSVLENIILEENQVLLSHYLSPDFSNDFDGTSSFNDVLDATRGYFKTYDFKIASYTIHHMEFLPENQARVRLSVRISYTNYFSGIDGATTVYTSDILWRREGTFWKIFRNMPYREGHPTQVGADARWGEIARAHALLQTALVQENLPVFISLISPNFSNDWDLNSNASDLLETARIRFNENDVKTATYTIQSIEFPTNDLAYVKCSAQVRVINIKNGTDKDSGILQAKVEWHREDSGWKIYRNLPYRFSHPKVILKSVLPDVVQNFF